MHRGVIYIYDIDYNIQIPEFKLFGATLIPKTQIDFNKLLENNTFKNVHDIYLIFADVIIVFFLCKYLHNVFVTIFGGKYIDDIADDVGQVGKKVYLEHKKGGANYKRNKAGFDTGGGK